LPQIFLPFFVRPLGQREFTQRRNEIPLISILAETALFLTLAFPFISFAPLRDEFPSYFIFGSGPKPGWVIRGVLPSNRYSITESGAWNWMF
jgi:hypothetical protein